MTTIEEGHLCFEFDSTWDYAEKWDESPVFKEGVQVVQGTDALDIVAYSYRRKECLLLEVKDFRDQNEASQNGDERTRHRKPNIGATAPTEGQVVSKLAGQCGTKVVGTIAGLVGAARLKNQPFAERLADALVSRGDQGFTVRVVLWVEGQPTSEGRSPRSKVNLGTLTNSLKRQVGWLTTHPVHALSTAAAPTVPGLTVTDNR